MKWILPGLRSSPVRSQPSFFEKIYNKNPVKIYSKKYTKKYSPCVEHFRLSFTVEMQNIARHFYSMISNVTINSAFKKIKLKIDVHCHCKWKFIFLSPWFPYERGLLLLYMWCLLSFKVSEFYVSFSCHNFIILLEWLQKNWRDYS